MINFIKKSNVVSNLPANIGTKQNVWKGRTDAINIAWGYWILFFCLSILVRLADAEDEVRGLRQQLQENQQGDYQEIGELRKK